MRNKFVPILSAAAGIFLLLRAVTPAAAGPAECAAIVNAFTAMADQHGYRQVVEMPKSNFRIEQIVLGNTIYTSTDGKWNKLELKPGGRKAIVAQILGESSVSDCAEMAADTLPSGRAKVYDFTMAAPKGMPGPKSTRQKVWIGTEDGLVRKMVGEEVTIQLSFDKLMPPIP